MNKIEPVVCEFNGLVHEIKSSLVVAPSSVIGKPGSTPVMCTAIWDTGAAFTVISSEVVKQLNLPALGKKAVHTANGIYHANVYSVDVMLPNKLVVSGVEVTDSDLKLCDALIGMDIIALGDMKISNKINTKFVFRIPAEGDQPM
ncbi:MAG: retroviral-like aspartic protease family protein [Kiritimatiellae bacterium]|nr:retroviral-like aspartic protease family protein [Kiritimatiellia bacterium]